MIYFVEFLTAYFSLQSIYLNEFSDITPLE